MDITHCDFSTNFATLVFPIPFFLSFVHLWRAFLSDEVKPNLRLFLLFPAIRSALAFDSQSLIPFPAPYPPPRPRAIYPKAPSSSEQLPAAEKGEKSETLMVDWCDISSWIRLPSYLVPVAAQTPPCEFARDLWPDVTSWVLILGPRPPCHISAVNPPSWTCFSRGKKCFTTPATLRVPFKWDEFLHPCRNAR